MQLAITWTNVDPVLWRYMASLGRSALTDDHEEFVYIDEVNHIMFIFVLHQRWNWKEFLKWIFL